MVFQRPRGTRDYMPEDMVVRRWVEDRLRKIFELYGYGEIATPAFELLELLEAKAGEEIKEQIYWFKDKSGRNLGLRFELTTSIARVVSLNPSMPKPIRFYYIQPVWRYEEPQRGRLREFYHAGVELIGVGDVSADAEIVAVAARAVREAGIDRFEIRVNDRRVVEALLRKHGIRDIEGGLRILDKLERRGRGFVVGGLVELGVDRGEAERLVDLLLAEGSNEEKLAEVGKNIGGLEEGLRGLEDLGNLLVQLEEGYGMSNVIVDFSIVRGLAYYTGFVFEIKSLRAKDVGSLAGGGRYDDLVRVVGGPDLPATGMAIGLERLIYALEAEGKLEGLRTDLAEVVVIPVGDVPIVEVLKIAETLRDAGIRAIMDITGRKISSALEHADRIGIPYALIVGRKELSTGELTLRNLATWTEKKLRVEDVIAELPKRRAGQLHNSI